VLHSKVDRKNVFNPFDVTAATDQRLKRSDTIAASASSHSHFSEENPDAENHQVIILILLPAMRMTLIKPATGSADLLSA
jgi:hypothetical protein